MIGLAGTRVIVVDDNKEEALPIMEAFAKKGIPTAFFKGPDKESLPSRQDRLIGVRLAVLDMELVEGVPEETKAATLVSYLKGILSPENGPYIVLAWTRHVNLIEAFENYIYKTPRVPKPVRIIRMEKKNFLKDGQKPSLPRLATKIKKELGKAHPIRVLQEWETGCFSAATSVTNTMSEMVTPGDKDPQAWRDKWQRELLILLHAMAHASFEKQLAANNCVNAVYSIFNPLHSDRLESSLYDICNILSEAADLILGSNRDCGPERKARLNTMLHLSLKDVGAFAAGNIYKFSPDAIPNWVPKVEAILEGGTQGNNDAQRTQKLTEIAGVSLPVIIEISAACDHAQKKIQRPRFLGGVLIPESHIDRVNRKSAFLKILGPLYFKEPVAQAGKYRLVFTSRHVVSIELDKMENCPAFARLRVQALSDLQFWFSYQASRPGMVLLE